MTIPVSLDFGDLSQQVSLYYKCIGACKIRPQRRGAFSMGGAFQKKDYYGDCTEV